MTNPEQKKSQGELTQFKGLELLKKLEDDYLLKA
jgi:hypothetical protein